MTIAIFLLRRARRSGCNLRRIVVDAPHFTDRVADVERWTGRPDATPDSSAEDREPLVDTLRRLRPAVVDRGASEQLLHGVPQPWNVLDTRSGPRRRLVSAVVAARCWRPPEERPGRTSRSARLEAVRAGPPWTALDGL